MNSFIVTTEEGKVIVIDGGYAQDAPKLLAKLQEITGSDRPHIDAWFLSHAHSDHIEAFMALVEHHADSFTCDALYYNFPSAQFIEKYENCELHTTEEFQALLPRFATYARTVSEGDIYEVGSAKFEILATPDTTITGAAINNTSIIFRMTLAGKTMMFLGDYSVTAGNKLLAKYGDALKSDYCKYLTTVTAV